MILPNKVIPIRESCLYKATILMKSLPECTSILNLYKTHKKKFIDVSEFTEVLDLLFITEKITVDLEKGTIKKC